MHEIKNRYVAGDTVSTKIDPKVKLIVRRYISRIYYCQFAEDIDRQELVLFDRELV